VLAKNKFADYVDRIYPTELEIKNYSYTASWFDQHLKIDNEGRLRTQLYAKKLFQYFHCDLSIYM
jgi:hypothetical protein